MARGRWLSPSLGFALLCFALTLLLLVLACSHKRMNAVRIRKESQVYSAEEKRALSMLNFEEKANKEKKLMSDFRKYLQDKGMVEAAGAAAGAAPGAVAATK